MAENKRDNTLDIFSTPRVTIQVNSSLTRRVNQIQELSGVQSSSKLQIGSFLLHALKDAVLRFFRLWAAKFYRYAHGVRLVPVFQCGGVLLE